MAEITRAEGEVLHLLTNEFLTPKQISIRRKTSKSITYRIIRSLKKKGLIDKNLKRVHFFGIGSKPNMIRLHREEFNIKIIYKDYRYKKILEKSNTLMIDGNTVRLYRNSIEIYSGQMFLGETAHKATSRSIEYWDRFIKRLENDLKVILLKSRYQNIKRVTAHYGETNNELAEDTNKADKIKVFANEDGKLWFLIDNSFNLNEAETVHPITSYGDMQNKVSPFFNDMRDRKDIVTISDLVNIMKETLDLHKETAAGLLTITSFLKAQLPKQEDLGNKDKPGYVG